jgi:transcriptional regulator with XRE-family HTH domain
MAKGDLRKAFGRRLRKLRQAAGLSQERLAQIVGLDRSYVGSVERGERNISIDNIGKFASGLHVRPSQLLDTDDG